MKRIWEIDVLRALAILLMVYTHAAMVIYDYSTPVFNSLSDLGGTLCFTMFLFAAGATLPILYRKYGVSKLRRHFLHRAAIFYGLYLAAGLLIAGLGEFGNVLLLRTVPRFADFILAFAYIFAATALCVPLLSLRTRYLIIGAVAAYILGSLLYYVEVNGALAPLKAIMVGHADWHRFPLLQYTLVFVLGLAYTRRRDWLTPPRMIALFVISFMVAVATNNLLPAFRWSVNVSFLLIGLCTVAGILLGLILAKRYLGKQDWTHQLTFISTRISRHALPILISHLVILQIVFDPFDIQTSYFLVIIVTAILITHGWALGQLLQRRL